MGKMWADMSKWGQTKQNILAICIIIAAGLVGYSWQRCSPAKEAMKEKTEEQAEKIAIKEEPSWINNGAHIATIAAWFNVFIGFRRFTVRPILFRNTTGHYFMTVQVQNVCCVSIGCK